MSLATACGVTVLRSFGIAFAGVLLSKHVSQVIEEQNSPRFVLLLFLILAPFLMPELIVGYTWWLISLKLVDYPYLIELIYSGLVLLKVVPVGIVCFSFATPVALSSEAEFLRKSIKSTTALINTFQTRWKFFQYQSLFRSAPVGALLFLLAFQEFEMASLLYRDSWTVWIFDAQAGGVPLLKTLSYLTGPLLIELVLLSGMTLLLFHSQKYHALNQRTQFNRISPTRKLSSCVYLLSAFLIMVVVPLGFISWGSLFALGSLLRNQLQLQGTLHESLWGLLYAGTAATAAWGLITYFFKPQRGVLGKAFGFLLCVPGLCGGLVLALAVAAFILTDFSYFLYDTPLAIFLGLILFLYPRALFLKLLMKRSGTDSFHLTRLLSQSTNPQQAHQGRRFQWALQGRMQYCAVVILSFWAYWNVTIGSILAPTQAQPVAVRLYNLMHYGQNSILSAVTLLSLSIPVCVALLLLPLVKILWIKGSSTLAVAEEK